MSGQCWWSDDLDGERNHRAIDEARDADAAGIRELADLRDSFEIQAHRANYLRVGGRRADDKPWCRAGKILGYHALTVCHSDRGYYVRMTVAFATVATVAASVTCFLALVFL